MSEMPIKGIDPEQILVGIPTLNEATHIEACLRSLMQGAPALSRVSFVIADGGSTDGTQDIVRSLARSFPNLALVVNPDRLQSAALNLVAFGHALPKHRFLVRCDAHSIYPPDYVLKVVESLVAREASSLVTAMDAVGEKPFQRAAAWAADSLLGSGGSAHRGGRRSGWVDHGHHAGFRLDWFRGIGGYDPTFSHNEDAEFDHRLGLASGCVWLDAEIRIAYSMRDSWAKLVRQYWNYGRGRARTVRKHRMRPRLRQMLPVVCVLALLFSLAAAPFFPIFIAIPAAYLAITSGFGVLTAVRERTISGLWSGPALLAIHLAWGTGFLWQFCLGGREDARPLDRSAEFPIPVVAEGDCFVSRVRP